MVLPDGILIESLMLPLPLAVKPVAPPVCVAVQVAPVKLAGKLSVTFAPTASEGPLFEALTVKVSCVPATTVPVVEVIELRPLLSVLVTERWAEGETLSVSVAVLFAAVGSVVPLGAET